MNRISTVFSKSTSASTFILCFSGNAPAASLHKLFIDMCTSMYQLKRCQLELLWAKNLENIVMGTILCGQISLRFNHVSQEQYTLVKILSTFLSQC
jgi:hypothetical protein